MQAGTNIKPLRETARDSSFPKIYNIHNEIHWTVQALRSRSIAPTLFSKKIKSIFDQGGWIFPRLTQSPYVMAELAEETLSKDFIAPVVWQ